MTVRWLDEKILDFESRNRLFPWIGSEQLFEDIYTQIRDNITQILLHDKKLGKAFSKANKSLKTAKKFNSINLATDTIDFLTLLYPIIGLATALSSVPGFLHKVLLLRKRLKHLEKLINN